MRRVVGVGVLLFALSFGAKAGLVAVATLSESNGAVKINGKVAQIGDELDVGTRVVVIGGKAWANFKFQNGHKIRVSQGEMVISDINPEKTLITLVRGKLLAWVSKLGGNKTFQVKTKRASFGVRGTKFMIEEGKVKTYLCVCEGEVEATRGKNKVLVKKDQDLNIPNTGALKVKDSPGMGKMVDEQIKAMGA